MIPLRWLGILRPFNFIIRCSEACDIRTHFQGQSDAGNDDRNATAPCAGGAAAAGAASARPPLPAAPACGRHGACDHPAARNRCGGQRFCHAEFGLAGATISTSGRAASSAGRMARRHGDFFSGRAGSFGIESCRRGLFWLRANHCFRRFNRLPVRSPKTFAPVGRAGTARPRFGTRRAASRECFPNLGAKPKIPLGVVFTAGQHFAQLAIDPSPWLRERLCHPA